MTNKLKHIFNSDDDILKGTIRFKDADSSNAFAEAIKSVYENGESVQISGVEELSWRINSGTTKFPLNEDHHIKDLVICPSQQRETIALAIEGNRVEFPLNYIPLKNGCVLSTTEDSIISVKMVFRTDSGSVKVSLTPHYDRAERSSDLLKNIQEIKALLDCFFIKDVQSPNNELIQMQQYLEELYDVVDRINYVEKTFDFSLDYSDIDLGDIESQQDLFELCLTMRDKKALRLNAKLTSTEATDLKLPNADYDIKENEDIAMTFLGNMEYRFWGKNIKLFSANLVCNAVIKSYENMDTGGVRIIYGDSESKPMYISYKGFISEDEAKEELATLMDHMEEYKNAKVPSQYWAEKNHII